MPLHQQNPVFWSGSREIHEYRIGGYQVCEKWLKDRKEHRLEFDDIRTNCRIVTAIDRTLTI